MLNMLKVQSKCTLISESVNVVRRSMGKQGSKSKFSSLNKKHQLLTFVTNCPKNVS